MASSMAFAGKLPTLNSTAIPLLPQLDNSIRRLFEWLEVNQYRGYDTFDGLSARYVRPFTLNNPFLRIALQQGVRRFPLNLRPLLGVSKSHSTKAMGFFARGFLRLFQATGDHRWRDKANWALEWLIDNQCPGYSGACWGNHFDYQSRTGYAPKGLPSVVWTSLIGHAFLDAYVQLQEPKFLEVAAGSCEHILNDLAHIRNGDTVCIGYFPKKLIEVHNANVLGASLLARTFSFTQNESYRNLAHQAIRYTVDCQRSDGSWYYGEAANLHWVDNFHTGYVLDSIKHYTEGSGDETFRPQLTRGYDYWKNTFFLPDGTPRYYDHKTLPIDIQCCSQAIDTFLLFSDEDPQAPAMAAKIAAWTIQNMQDRTGYFYYRRYSRWLVNKTPTLHWGQATMFCALTGLYQLALEKGNL